MSFTSILFVAFFAIVFPAYWLTRGRARKVLLLGASYLFYAAWDWRFVGLLVLSTVVDYLVGARIAAAASAPAKRRWVATSLLVNLGVLGAFKYTGFFVDSAIALLGSLGWHPSLPALRIAVPVGVSFYTFRTLSYTLDVFRGQLKPTRSLLDYAVFVGFFPLLGAGPIVRARQFLPQLAKQRGLSATDVETGVSRFVLGFVKKAFIADTLGLYLVDPVFARPNLYAAGAHWLAMIGYAAQIYADFSGYSSMAIGISRLFGFKVPENFEFPYLAQSASEFWRRWHISLTSWLRDYLWWHLAKNLPFGGSFFARMRWSAVVVIVFLASGLWHGAGWTFVVWGGIHGACVAVHQRWRAARENRRGPDGTRPLPVSVAAWAVTQLLVVLAWVLFRARDFPTAWTFLGGLVGSAGQTVLTVPDLAWVALGSVVVDHVAGYLLEHHPAIRARIPVPLRGLVYAALVVLLWHGTPSHAGDFIYFRF